MRDVLPDLERWIADAVAVAVATATVVESKRIVAVMRGRIPDARTTGVAK